MAGVKAEAKSETCGPTTECRRPHDNRYWRRRGRISASTTVSVAAASATRTGCRRLDGGARPACDDCATDARFPPVKPRGATDKSLIVLEPPLSLNQRV